MALDVRSAIIADLTDGRIVAGKNTDMAVPTASLAKLMTAATLLRLGAHYNQHDMKRFLSLSDASVAGKLIRSSGLSRKNFVAEMNRTARMLGMNNSNFVSTVGASNTQDSTSSAADMTRLMQHLYARDNGKFLHDYASPAAGVGHSMDGYVFPNPHVIGAKNGELPDRYSGAVLTKGAGGHIFMVFYATRTQEQAENAARTLVHLTEDRHALNHTVGRLDFKGTALHTTDAGETAPKPARPVPQPVA